MGNTIKVNEASSAVTSLIKLTCNNVCFVVQIYKQKYRNSICIVGFIVLLYLFINYCSYDTLRKLKAQRFMRENYKKYMAFKFDLPVFDVFWQNGC